MSFKFKYGDRVIANGYPGKVVSVFKENGKNVCTVKFDNVFLIPPKMDFKESDIKFEDEGIEKCPLCNEKWTVTVFNNKTWRDCKKCNKKSEECIEEHKNLKTKKQGYGIKQIDENKLLNEFEKMLGGYDHDDDDFGWFD